jgi:hypothetical protein
MSATTSIRQQALNAEHPLAFFINGYGDNFINLPALRALCRLFEGRLTLVCKDGPHLFCFDGLGVKRRVTLRAGYNETEVGYKFDVAEAAEQIGACDLFVSLTPWCSPALVELLGKWGDIPSVGFFEAYRQSLRLDYSKLSADLAFDVVRTIEPDYRLDDFLEPLRYPDDLREDVREIFSALEPGTRTLSVHMDTLPHKMWDDGRWVETLDGFLEARPDFVALIVGRPQQPFDSEQCRHAERVIPCYGLPLSSSCCLVAESDIFVGVDSCMLHVADMARVPGVGLFGPTSAKEFGFYIGPHIMIQAEGSMGQIGQGRVLEALNRLAAEPAQASTWRAEVR